MTAARTLTGLCLSLAACAATVTPAAPPTLLATRVAANHATHLPRDFDSDGFPDPADRCPAVAGLAPHGCPDPDSDGDGYRDSEDRCRADPGVEPDGCPIPDLDGDGILDPDDRCVPERESKNGYFDEDGCPDEIPADLATITGTIHGIHFVPDKDVLLPKSRRTLDRCVALLAKYPDIRIEVSGHIDSPGTGPDYRRRAQLDGRRARAVKNYFVAHGILADRIETRGAGTDEPVDTNKTAAGRAKNRRVEIAILVQ